METNRNRRTFIKQKRIEEHLSNGNRRTLEIEEHYRIEIEHYRIEIEHYRIEIEQNIYLFICDLEQNILHKVFRTLYDLYTTSK